MLVMEILKVSYLCVWYSNQDTSSDAIMECPSSNSAKLMDGSSTWIYDIYVGDPGHVVALPSPGCWGQFGSKQGTGDLCLTPYQISKINKQTKTTLKLNVYLVNHCCLICPRSFSGLITLHSWSGN